MEHIRAMTESDWERVAEIYRQGMETNLSTFETQCPEYEQWDASHLKNGRLVCELDGRVVGWVALSPVSGRCAYRGVAEISVYVADGVKHRGVGTELIDSVIRASEEMGYWTLQSVVLEENAASLALHRKCGFRVVGTREKIARDRFGKWRNTVLLERRSTLACLAAEEPEQPEKSCLRAARYGSVG